MAFELTGNPLNDISAPIEELSESFNSTLVFDFGNGVGITQYTFWMIIICAIVIVGVLVGAASDVIVLARSLDPGLGLCRTVLVIGILAVAVHG